MIQDGNKDEDYTSDEEEDWGGKSPSHLFLLKIGMWRQIIHPSIFLLNIWVCDAFHVVALSRGVVQCRSIPLKN